MNCFWAECHDQTRIKRGQTALCLRLAIVHETYTPTSSHMSGAEIHFDVNTKLDSARARVSDHNGHKVDNHGDTCDTEEQLLDEEMGRARAEHTAKERRKRRNLNETRASAQRKVDMKTLLPEEHLDTDIADSLSTLLLLSLTRPHMLILFLIWERKMDTKQQLRTR